MCTHIKLCGNRLACRPGATPTPLRPIALTERSDDQVAIFHLDHPVISRPVVTAEHKAYGPRPILIFNERFAVLVPMRYVNHIAIVTGKIVGSFFVAEQRRI